MRRTAVVGVGLALAIIAACSDDDSTAPPASTPTNDGGTSGTSGANGTSGTSGGAEGGAPSCIPLQLAGDCQVVVCNPDGTTTSKPDDTDVPTANGCGTETCQDGKRVATSTADAGTKCGSGICDGNGVCSDKLGTACGSKADCPSGFCVDGVCCVEACTGECKSCSVEGSKGLCTNIPFNQEDVSYQDSAGTKIDCTTAVGGARCNGKGKCLRQQGTACNDDATCLGGKCSGANKCLGAPGEICNALGDCASNMCAMGTCK